jgi:nicotinamide-nucleotide amidase
MPTPDDTLDAATVVAQDIAELAPARGLTVAVAESLTGGKIACQLAAAPASADWFRGGVVAYAPEVKFQVLGVPPGPVVTEECARSMADGVARLLGADVAVAVTGVGGPDPEEGHPPGTVWFAVAADDGVHTERHSFDGGPEEVLERTTHRALELLRENASDRARVT